MVSELLILFFESRTVHEGALFTYTVLSTYTAYDTIYVYGIRHYSRIWYTVLFTYTAYDTIHVYNVRYYSCIRYYSCETVEAIQEFYGAKQEIVV